MTDVLLEIRTYRLRPGKTQEFDRLSREQAGPLLRKFGIDVVRAAPTLVADDGEETYVLLRAFGSATERREQEARFYGSREWRDGPREAILAGIESYHTVVVPVPAEALAGLRG